MFTNPFLSTKINKKMTSTFYKVVGKEQEIFEHAFKNKLPLLLKGPTGTGKSRFVEFMAEKSG